MENKKRKLGEDEQQPAESPSTRSKKKRVSGEENQLQNQKVEAKRRIELNRKKKTSEGNTKRPRKEFRF